MPLQNRFKKIVAPIVTTNGPRLLSVQGAAEYLSANVFTIRKLIREGQLPLVQLV